MFNEPLVTFGKEQGHKSTVMLKLVIITLIGAAIFFSSLIYMQWSETTHNTAYGVSNKQSETNNYSIQELQDFCVNKRNLTVIDVRYDQQLKEVFLVISHPSTVSVIDLEEKQETKTGKLTSYSTTNLLFLILEKGDVLSERLLVKKAEELRLPYLSKPAVVELKSK